MNAKYLIVLEPTEGGYSAYSPDVLGCVAAGATKSEVEREMQAAIQFHLEGLREEGESPPPPHCTPAYVEVAV